MMGELAVVMVPYGISHYGGVEVWVWSELREKQV